MICAETRKARVGSVFLLFQCSDLLVSTSHQPILPCGVPSIEFMPVLGWVRMNHPGAPFFMCGSGSQKNCEVPGSDWACSSFLRTSFRVQWRDSLPAYPTLVWKRQEQIMAFNYGQPSLLIPPFPSLSLVSHPYPLSPWVPCSALLKHKPKYGELIATAAIVQA